MKETLKIIFALAAILGGVSAIIVIVGSAELIILSLSLTFGIMAIIWTVMAHGSLSPGSSLRSYTGHFLACLILILISSLWTGIAKILGLSGAWNYVDYIFMTLAYVVFVVTANKIYHLGREFGFQGQARKIKEAMKKKGRDRQRKESKPRKAPQATR